MKKITLFVLLALFVIQCTSRIWIVVSFYYQRDYVANNYCKNRLEKIPVCKGFCFLEEQINQQEKSEQKLPILKIEEIQIFVQKICKIEWVENRPFLNYPSEKNEFIIVSDFLFSVFHPPQFA